MYKIYNGYAKKHLENQFLTILLYLVNGTKYYIKNQNHLKKDLVLFHN